MRFTINDENNFFKDKDKAYIEPPKKMPFLLKSQSTHQALMQGVIKYIIRK